MSSNKQKIIISPNICGYADDNHENYQIEVELPGVEKNSIMLKMHEDSFFLKAETKSNIFVGSYSLCCPVNPSKAQASYNNGLLKVNIPFQNPLEDAIDIKIE